MHYGLSKNMIAYFLLLWTSSYQNCNGANILMLPLNSNSHVVYFRELGFGLTEHGHSVTMMIPSSANINLESKSNFTVYRYHGTEYQYASSKEFNKKLVKFALSSSLYEKVSVMKEMVISNDKLIDKVAEDCFGLANNKELMKLVAKYDFAILDTMFPNCYYTIAYKYSIPYASLGLYGSNMFNRIPMLPSQVPNVAYECSDDMNFIARLMNTLIYIMQYVSFTSIFQHSYMSRIAPEKPPITTMELIERTTLNFLLSDPILEYPAPAMPSSIFIGDIMAQRVKQLPHDLDMIISQAEHGVILVSFGTMLQEVPKNFADRLFEGLGKLRETIIIKKINVNTKIPPNVKQIAWLPQNDILGHRKTKLFISHCGINSVIEAVTHKVPILGMPLAGDQPRNAYLVQNKGIGKVLSWGMLFNSTVLVQHVEEVISNPTYKANIQNLSDRFLDKPDSAASRASHMISHVIKYGDSHLKTKAFSLNLLQYYMIDIYLFLTVSLILITVLIGVCIKCCLRMARQICCRSELPPGKKSKAD